MALAGPPLSKFGMMQGDIPAVVAISRNASREDRGWETKGIALGLRQNWQQFTLLVLINAFVGAKIGVGVYRLWRDSGFAIGAIIAGMPAETVAQAEAHGLAADLDRTIPALLMELSNLDEQLQAIS